MNEGQKAFWLGAGLVVVLAVSGVTLWQVVENPTAGIKTQLAALTTKVDATSAKLDKTDAALSEVRKATTSDAIGKGLGQLEAKLKTVNDALDASVKTIRASLADIQKSLAAGDADSRLDALGADIKNINAALAKLSQPASVHDINAQLEALNASITRTDASLTQIKEALGAQNVASRIAPLDAKLTTVSDTLAEIKKTDSLESVSKALSALSDKLDETNKALAGIKTPAVGSKMEAAAGDLQKNIADADALHDKLAQDIGKLEAALTSKPHEMMVVYLHMPSADKLPKTVATVSPLNIEFTHVGSTDDNGQATAIIPKLKQIIGSQAGCVISVAGYADTLGGDKTNLALSKKRAHTIAEKIKTAFAGTDVQINEAAWGERRLHDWTPDNMAKEANRRVDIAVNCEK